MLRRLSTRVRAPTMTSVARQIPIRAFASRPKKTTTALKEMIKSPNLEFIMEAHNGLSAKIVEEAGFKGIWGSGLSISAATGLRDSNELSYTQVLDILGFMTEGVKIPILLDGDTGYGNFNNARRLVKQLERIGVAGVCIEDKIFPKTNSLLPGAKEKREALADIDEFCGKLKAMRDTQTDPDFVLVARIEAFISGWGLEEALKRATAYKNAGVDAVLIHSSKKENTEIKSFCEAWKNQCPVVIVPTKYYTTPTEEFKKWGVSLCIWANHNMRASVAAMQKTTKQIFNDQSLVNVEKNVAPVEEVFRIQGQAELTAAEKIYLPQKAGK